VYKTANVYDVNSSFFSPQVVCPVNITWLVNWHWDPICVVASWIKSSQ